MPASPPAPIKVCASSINIIIGVVEFLTSSITVFKRRSNSPLTPAPACNNPISSTNKRTPCKSLGTCPSIIRWAKPSTTAVLPTPGSPTKIGLFFLRRHNTSTIIRISSLRPRTGSILPCFAFSVKSSQYSSSAAVPCDESV